MWVRSGVRKDGEILALHFRTWLDGGAYGSYGVASTFYTGALQTVTYRIARYKFEGCRVFTNKPPCGPKRGHGTPQPRFALEVHLDKIAEELGLDPAEMRRRTVVPEHEKTVNHLHRDHVRPPRVHRPRGGGVGVAGEVPEAPAGPRHRVRGVRLPVRRRACRSTGTTCRTPASMVKIDRGGGVAVFCGSTDIGQGSDSILAYVVAEVLGDPARGRAGRHRRHRPHAGRPRLVLLARDAHDRQRGPRGGARSCASQLLAAAAKKLEASRPRSSRPATGASSCATIRPRGSRSTRRRGWPRRRTGRSSPPARTRRPGAPRSSRARGSARRPRTPTRRASWSSRSTRRPATSASTTCGSPTTAGPRSTRSSWRARSRARSTWGSARP